jgi:hypothetical protein
MQPLYTKGLINESINQSRVHRHVPLPIHHFSFILIRIKLAQILLFS